MVFVLAKLAVRTHYCRNAAPGRIFNPDFDFGGSASSRFRKSEENFIVNPVATFRS